MRHVSTQPGDVRTAVACHARRVLVLAVAVAAVVVPMVTTPVFAATAERYRVVTTLPGFSQPFGIVMDHSGSNLWVADRGDGTIKEVALHPTPHVVATLGGFGGPMDLALDSSGQHLWVADAFGGAVREVATSSPPSIVSTLGGFGQPGGIALDPTSGDVWASDVTAGTVVQIDPTPTPHVVATVTGFSRPAGVAVSLDSSDQCLGGGVIVSCPRAMATSPSFSRRSKRSVTWPAATGSASYRSCLATATKRALVRR